MFFKKICFIYKLVISKIKINNLESYQLLKFVIMQNFIEIFQLFI